MRRGRRTQFGSAVFILLMLLSGFFLIAPLTVTAAQDGDYTYTTDGYVATITGYTGPGGAIAIPATLGGYQTAAIGDYAFYECTSLTTLNVPNNVTSIGNWAFGDCTSLTSIAIGSKVETIGYTAFYHCSSLISIIVPNSVTYVGPWTFYGCSALISATIGDHLASISNRMFAECKSLSYVTIGSGVTSIEEAAFYNCTSLTSLVFLGLHAPTSVAETWIWVVNEGIKGHAYATSNFPSPGGVWNRLTMGEVLPTTPLAPANLTATPESTHAVLVWMAPSNNGGKNITSYRVYRNDSVNSTFVLIGSSTELNYIDKGLAYGLTYWYKVSAVNSMGEGANCSSVSSIVYQPIGQVGDGGMLIMIVAIIVVGAILAVLFVMRGRNRKA